MRRERTGSDTAMPIVKSVVLPNEYEIPKKSPPLYQTIHFRLSEKIAMGALPKGGIVKEGSLADVFGVSRAPVRRALQILEKENVIRPGDGQGFVIGNGAAKGPVSVRDLRTIILDQPESEMNRAATWEKIYDNILLDVTNCMPFGTFRISETIACEHFSIGRTALRDGLGRLLADGYLEKTTHSPWMVGSLTARDVHEVFEVRLLLEPAAFDQTVAELDKAVIQAIRDRIVCMLTDLEQAHPEDIEIVENDLHHALLGRTKNRRLLSVIERNQFPVIVNKIFRRNFGLKPDLPALVDHVEMLGQLLKNRIDVTRTMLKTHLKNEEQNTLAKLRVLSILPKPTTAPYLISVH